MQIEKAIERGITYLRSIQLADGSFAGHSSPTIQPFTVDRSYRTTFLPALILHALGGIEAAQPVRQPLAAWLKAQRSPTGTFNYWAVNAPERQSMPYPDDLDDTFCALAALYRHDPELIDAATLGAAVKILLAAEQQVGGPYRTWLVSRDAPQIWQDVDLAVNCNIAYFLRQVAEPLPNLTALMDQAITSNSFTSPYYPSPMPILYYMARAYQGEQAGRLIPHIEQQQGATALDSALRICALLEVGQYKGLSGAIGVLLRGQQADGSWPEAAFCLDAARQGKLFYHGSPALTTAFVLEALSTYTIQSLSRAQPVTTVSEPYGSIITAAKRAANGLDSDLRPQFVAMIDHMAQGDVNQEIALLPQLFNTSLIQPSKISASTLQQLSLANLFGWMAYTIYDDFLDDEGQPTLLPVANVAMRKSLEAFGAAVPQGNFQHFVGQTFDIIDSANAWEITQCHFTVTGERVVITQLPNYGGLQRLAERSFGHILTPLAILATAGYPLDSKAAKHVQTALRHYLIARQLQDDLHDWEDDLRAGRLTAVVVEILRSAYVQPGDYRFAELFRRMHRQFWPLVFPKVCARIGRHLAIGRRHMASSGLLRSDGHFYSLFNRLDTVMQDMRVEQSKAADFLAAYKKPLD